MSEAVDPRTRAEIEDFLLAYAHTIDDGNLEAWPGYFTEEAIYQITTRENHEAGLPLGIFYCEGRGMMSDRIMALRTANIFEPHTYCHMLSGTSLVRDGDALAARTNFTVVRTMQDGAGEMFAVGKYLDRIVLETDGPKLSDRRVVLESRRVDVLLVFPL